MSMKFDIAFSASAVIDGGLAIQLKLSGDAVAAGVAEVDPQAVAVRAAGIAKFKGKALSTLDILAPAGSKADRLIVLGLGKADKLTAYDWLKAGGVAAAAVKTMEKVTVFLDAPGADVGAAEAADFATGMLLRAYKFDTYKTKKKDDDEDKSPKTVTVTIVTAKADAATEQFVSAKAIAEGVILARDLVNLPPNVLGPIEFAQKAKDLESLGVDVEILTETEMTELGMGALLGVAQGSSRPPRLAIMTWNGGTPGDQPVAFVGKGVVFDTGGISIKPSLGMEDMKGDMGGAAAVTGLMHTLAARKAKANVIGIIGLRFKPRFMIDLATLTGAIVVALGNLHAGLFSNDDALADELTQAGETSGEKLWRMPLSKDYDKMIDSRFADMKNSGGRQAGSITAAQFLKRFVGDTPWAHLDIAATALNSPQNEINQSWASGYGVRLLDELVRKNYEN
ncbi:MAG: leucyl aminopeptidase [Rhizobiaceae bacterium]|nr:MAG: leucyl aminopeptidase [Rhizobiaceae bacterium]